MFSTKFTYSLMFLKSSFSNYIVEAQKLYSFFSYDFFFLSSFSSFFFWSVKISKVLLNQLSPTNRAHIVLRKQFPKTFTMVYMFTFFCSRSSLIFNSWWLTTKLIWKRIYFVIITNDKLNRIDTQARFMTNLSFGLIL